VDPLIKSKLPYLETYALRDVLPQVVFRDRKAPPALRPSAKALTLTVSLIVPRTGLIRCCIKKTLSRRETALKQWQNSARSRSTASVNNRAVVS